MNHDSLLYDHRRVVRCPQCRRRMHPRSGARDASCLECHLAGLVARRGRLPQEPDLTAAEAELLPDGALDELDLQTHFQGVSPCSRRSRT